MQGLFGPVPGASARASIRVSYCCAVRCVKAILATAAASSFWKFKPAFLAINYLELELNKFISARRTLKMENESTRVTATSYEYDTRYVRTAVRVAVKQ